MNNHLDTPLATLFHQMFSNFAIRGVALDSLRQSRGEMLAACLESVGGGANAYLRQSHAQMIGGILTGLGGSGSYLRNSVAELVSLVGKWGLPPLPAGFVFLVDENGLYLVDEMGNYLIAGAS